MTLFTRILQREIPAKIVYEDDLCFAIEDINPQAPVHLLVIPKQEIPSSNDLSDADAVMLGRIFAVIRQLAADNGLRDDGYRIVNNCGTNGGQTVPHLHFHLIGGRRLGWPPG